MGYSEQLNKERVGFITYVRTPYPEKNPRVGMIQYMSVEEEHQDKGYGKFMLQHALNDLDQQGCSMVIVSVKCDNEKALDLFKKNDFVVNYQDDFDNVVLVRNYNPQLAKQIPNLF